VSANGTGAVPAVTEIVQGFFDRFAPPPVRPQSNPPPAASAGVTLAGPLAGFYQPARHNESTVEKLVTLLGPARLTVGADATVRFGGKTYRSAGGGLYREAGGSGELVFLAGPDGRRYVATDAATFQRIPTDQTPMVNLVVVLAFTVAALSGLAVPVAWLVRRLRRRPAPLLAGWRVARVLAAGAAALGLAFVVLLGTVLFGDTGEFLYRVPTSFRLLLLLPFGVAAMATAAAVGTFASWRGSGAGLAARVHQVVLFAGLAALAWFVWEWNLIGWRF
jgi:hypothetical protein